MPLLYAIYVKIAKILRPHPLLYRKYFTLIKIIKNKYMYITYIKYKIIITYTYMSNHKIYKIY